jgi:hypothetical protein
MDTQPAVRPGSMFKDKACFVAQEVNFAQTNTDRPAAMRAVTSASC